MSKDQTQKLINPFVFKTTESVCICTIDIIDVYSHFNQVIGLMSRVFANSLGDQGSVPGRAMPKTQKMILDTALLNIQHHKVRIKGKVKQSREWNNSLPNILVW